LLFLLGKRAVKAEETLSEKVYFIGAGPGDAELISVKGARLIGEAETVIWAGSLVNKDILQYASETAEIFDSAGMDIHQMTQTMKKGIEKGKPVARVHTGDPSLYGAIGEQMAELDKLGIEYEVIPGITSISAAAAVMQTELTLPEISQTLIISRVEGRTPVPEGETLENFAKIGGTLALYLSVGMIDEIVERMIKAGRSLETPVNVIYRATWEDQKIFRGTLETIAGIVKENKITKHALVIIGDVLKRDLKEYSKLYDREFTHEYRKARSNSGN